MSRIYREHHNYAERDDNYNFANDYCYGTMSSSTVTALVNTDTESLFFNLIISYECESSYTPRNSDYRDKNYYYYYTLRFSNGDVVYEKKLFSRKYREYGNEGLIGNKNREFEVIDSRKVSQGLNEYLKPLVEYLSANNGLGDNNSKLNELCNTVGTIIPPYPSEKLEDVSFREEVTLDFLNQKAAKEQREANKQLEEEASFFSGCLQWISFRFHFVYGKSTDRSSRIKLILTVMNSTGLCMNYDVFDYRSNLTSYREWFESWVSFVNTEGKASIVRILNKLSSHKKCIQDLIEWNAINKIVKTIAGREDYETGFTFTGNSENKGRDERKDKKKKRNESTDSMSVKLGFLCLESLPETFEELKKAFRNACFAFHPDRFSGAEKKKWAEDRLKKISEAFEELSKLYA